MSGIIPLKQPIKRLEIPLSKFDVAIPYYLDLLKRHKDNIQKYKKDNDFTKVHKEQTNALRLVKQLEQILYEMEALRNQVENSDIQTFDDLTRESRISIINSIQEYLEMKLECPTSVTSSPGSPEEQSENSEASNKKFLQVQTEQEELERHTACLHAWNSLQNDLYQLQQLFINMNQLINDQKQNVSMVEDNVINSQEDVVKGNDYLEKASKLKVLAYPLAGALIGTCIGGPVGLVAGIKLGGLTALGCGILGFTGATILKKKQLASVPTLPIKDKEDYEGCNQEKRKYL